jgi:hypothetical protein
MYLYLNQTIQKCIKTNMKLMILALLTIGFMIIYHGLINVTPFIRVKHRYLEHTVQRFHPNKYCFYQYFTINRFY